MGRRSTLYWRPVLKLSLPMMILPTLVTETFSVFHRKSNVHFNVSSGVLLFLSLWFTACSGDNSNISSAQLTLLHTNDTHSQLESVIPYGEPEQGGITRRKTLIDAVRTEVGADQVLLVDAGDFSQGTIYYNAWQGSADIMALNNMGYDVCSLGNHEFDLGVESFVRALNGDDIEIAGQTWPTEPLRVPLISTNLDFHAEPQLAEHIQTSVVLHKNNQSYGIVGVTTESLNQISNTGSNIIVAGYVSSVQAEIDRLTAQGINKIILLSHVGYAVDLHLATRLSGVDIVVSGHDHPLLLPSAAYAEGAPLEFLATEVVGDYPTVLADRDGDPLLIVGAYEQGKILGRLDVSFDRAGVITHWVGDPLFVDSSSAPDPELAAKLSQYKNPIAEFSDVVIGQVGMFFDSRRYPGLRSQERPLGNLLADAILNAASTYDRAVAAIINSGGIRASLPQNVDPSLVQPPYDITYGEAWSVIPFSNTIITLDVTGEQLVAALDNGLSWAFDDKSMIARSSGAFPQISGMQVTYCRDRVNDIYADSYPPTRCSEALISGGVVTALQVAGDPVDLNATYRIATNDFLAGGGDFYTSLATASETPAGHCIDSGILMLDALIQLFADTESVHRQTEGRLIAE